MQPIYIFLLGVISGIFASYFAGVPSCYADKRMEAVTAKDGHIIKNGNP